MRAVVAQAISAVLAIAPTAAAAQQLPTGGSVAVGSATIGTPHGGTLDINQSSNRAILDWHSFSIGQGGTVNFNQPSAASATLNRVTGNTPSSIAGTINAPGTVLLVNPNGIAITKDGVINTGSFAASTLDIKNSDFMSGNYKFTGNGNSAAVTNAGRINVSDGGFAALLGGQVANDGTITARLGKVALGSGELVTLDLSGDGFLSVAVPTKDLGKIKGVDGKCAGLQQGQDRRRWRRGHAQGGDRGGNPARCGQCAGLDPGQFGRPSQWQDRARRRGRRARTHRRPPQGARPSPQQWRHGDRDRRSRRCVRQDLGLVEARPGRRRDPDRQTSDPRS